MIKLINFTHTHTQARTHITKRKTGRKGSRREGKGNLLLSYTKERKRMVMPGRAGRSWLVIGIKQKPPPRPDWSSIFSIPRPLALAAL